MEDADPDQHDGPSPTRPPGPRAVVTGLVVLLLGVVLVAVAGSAQAADLYADDFTGTIDEHGWASIRGADISDDCGRQALTFVREGRRHAETRSIDTREADRLSFRFKYGKGGDVCQRFLDSDGVDVQFSTDGGGTWEDLDADLPGRGRWKDVRVDLPAEARRPETRFRWIQPGAQKTPYLDSWSDAWAIDDVRVEDTSARALAEALICDTQHSFLRSDGTCDHDAYRRPDLQDVEGDADARLVDAADADRDGVPDPVEPMLCSTDPSAAVGTCDDGDHEPPVHATLFADDFEDQVVDPGRWEATSGATELAGRRCADGSDGALAFDGAGDRAASTRALALDAPARVQFELVMGRGGAPCEHVDPDERVALQYSTDDGTSWTTISTYLPRNHPTFTPETETVPADAVTPSTRLRWVQTDHSGDVLPSADGWAIDDVRISVPVAALPS